MLYTITINNFPIRDNNLPINVVHAYLLEGLFALRLFLPTIIHEGEMYWHFDYSYIIEKLPLLGLDEKQYYEHMAYLKKIDILKVAFTGKKRYLFRFTEKAQLLHKLESDIKKEKQCNNATPKITTPKSGFIYFLFNKGDLVYIGQTAKLKSRIDTHKKSDKIFDSYSYIKVSENVCLNKTEGAYIKKYKPILNKTKYTLADIRIADVNPYELPQYLLTEIKNLP